MLHLEMGSGICRGQQHSVAFFAKPRGNKDGVLIVKAGWVVPWVPRPSTLSHLSERQRGVADDLDANAAVFELGLDQSRARVYEWLRDGEIGDGIDLVMLASTHDFKPSGTLRSVGSLACTTTGR